MTRPAGSGRDTIIDGDIARARLQELVAKVEPEGALWLYRLVRLVLSPPRDTPMNKRKFPSQMA